MKQKVYVLKNVHLGEIYNFSKTFTEISRIFWGKRKKTMIFMDSWLFFPWSRQFSISFS